MKLKNMNNIMDDRIQLNTYFDKAIRLPSVWKIQPIYQVVDNKNGNGILISLFQQKPKNIKFFLKLPEYDILIYESIIKLNQLKKE